MAERAMTSMTLDFGLGENAEMIRDTTQRFATDKIAPLAAKIDADDWFPAIELWTAMGELGLHGITVDEEDGGLGLGYLEHVSRGRGSQPCLRFDRPFLWRAQRTCASTRFAAGQSRTKGEISAQADFGRTCRQPCDVGSGRWLRRRFDEAEGRRGARRLCAERHQILDHQRALCRHFGRLCKTAPESGIARDQRLPDRKRRWRASPSARRSTKWACAVRRRRNWYSTTVLSRRPQIIGPLHGGVGVLDVGVSIMSAWCLPDCNWASCRPASTSSCPMSASASSSANLSVRSS